MITSKNIFYHAIFSVISFLGILLGVVYMTPLSQVNLITLAIVSILFFIHFLYILISTATVEIVEFKNSTIPNLQKKLSKYTLLGFLYCYGIFTLICSIYFHNLLSLIIIAVGGITTYAYLLYIAKSKYDNIDFYFVSSMTIIPLILLTFSFFHFQYSTPGTWLFKLPEGEWYYALILFLALPIIIIKQLFRSENNKK